MLITDTLFHAYLECPTKCFLIGTGEEPPNNKYADWFLAQSELYRNDRAKQIIEGKKNEKCVVGQLSTNIIKNPRWRFAVNSAAQAKGIETTIQVMERIPSKGKGQPTQFIPIRFVFSNKINKHEKLLLALDALVLYGMFGRKASVVSQIKLDK